MPTTTVLVLYTVGVFAAAVVGGILPFVRRWSSEQLHLFVALGAGVFLGTVFLHLLPEIVHEGPVDLASVMVLSGFLAILLLERVLLRHHSHLCGENCPHRHEITGITSFVGLSVHALTAGFSLGVAVLNPKLGAIILLALMAHKATETFSLSTIFVLAKLRTGLAVALLLAFSLLTPLGALAAIPFIDTLKQASLVIPTGLAAGTFLYVATMDLLPEAFHEDEGRVFPFVFILIGVVIMYYLGRLGL